MGEMVEKSGGHFLVAEQSRAFCLRSYFPCRLLSRFVIAPRMAAFLEMQGQSDALELLGIRFPVILGGSGSRWSAP